MLRETLPAYRARRTDTEGSIRCSECRREIDEFVAISERWSYWSDGCGELRDLALVHGPEWAHLGPNGRPIDVQTPQISAR